MITEQTKAGYNVFFSNGAVEDMRKGMSRYIMIDGTVFKVKACQLEPVEELKTITMTVRREAPEDDV